jgi:aldose 1-epimerase
VIGERTIDGIAVLTLATDEGGGLEAAFAPGAGMVGCSLRHRGDELLGQRGGLSTYVSEHSTMGIPLLHPWANRVSETRFSVADREVVLEPLPPSLSLGPKGLPIHGLLAASPGWQVERHEALAHGGTLAARFDFGADAELIAAFPFPHQILFEATLDEAALTIATTVRAGESPVPVSFGYHPYLTLPGVDRAEWELEAPVRERLVLDERKLPTGAREPVRIAPGRLGTRTFDDEYVAPQPAAPFALSGGGRRIKVSFGEGYPFAQIYAPDDDDVVAIEPMTAPTNALVTGGPDLPVLAAGESHRAEFSIGVRDEVA